MLIDRASTISVTMGTELEDTAHDPLEGYDAGATPDDGDEDRGPLAAEISDRPQGERRSVRRMKQVRRELRV